MHLSRAAETLRWFLIPVMTEQKNNGNHVIICTSGTPDECVNANGKPDAEWLKELGFDVFNHGTERSVNPYTLLRAIFRIRKLLIEQQIDVIVCHNPLGSIIGEESLLN